MIIFFRVFTRIFSTIMLLFTFVSLALISFVSLAETDVLTVSADIQNISKISTNENVAISSVITPTNSSSTNNYLQDKDVITYLPMDNYDTNTYNYGNKTVYETANVISRFDNGIAQSSIHQNITLSSEGKFDSALNFAGGNIKLALFGTTLGDVRQSGYSYSAWIKPAEIGSSMAIMSSGPYYRFTTNFSITNTGVLSFYYGSDDTDGSKFTLTGNTVLNANTWYHVAAVYNPTSKTTSIYLNGTLEASNSSPLAFGHQDLGLSLIIGSTPSTNSGDFLGLIDDVIVFKRAITSEYISDIYNQQYYQGSIIYNEIILPASTADDGTYNTLTPTITETQPGSSQVSVWQDNAWHRVINNEPAIFDMAKRMPLSTIKFKVELLANTQLQSINFTVSNNSYSGSENDLSFIFMGDDNGAVGVKAIINAYENIPNLKMVFSVPDNGWGSGLSYNYQNYAKAWLTNPNADYRYIPIFSGLGNHDVEVPTDVDYASKVLGENVSTALPGMRNYVEGPFDTYSNGYEDTKLNYSFDYKNTHFLMLNGYFHDKEVEIEDTGKYHDRMDPDGYSPFSHVSEDMLTWIETSLSATGATHKFLFFHEGAFPPPGQRHYGDSLDNIKAPGNNGDNNTRPMRDRFWSILAKHNVTATMMGHNHTPAQTWVADPSGVYAPVYELEPGYLLTTVKYAVVGISDNKVSVKYMDSDQETKEFYQSAEDLIIDRSAPSTHIPVLKQFSAEKESGYKALDKSLYNIEVGGETSAEYNDLYFEARDNDISDELVFSVTNLPSFLQVNEKLDPNDVNQFRRISLSTNASINTNNIGSYDVTVNVTDGINIASKTVTINVLSSTSPEIYGSNITNNETYTQLREALFLCKDNSVISTGRIYNNLTVTWNGLALGQNGITGHTGWRPKSYMPYGDTLMYFGLEFKETKVPAGDYTITAVCNDIYSNTSSPFTINFTIIDDGTLLENETPWIDSVFPVPGDVETLPVINISTKANNSSNTTLKNALIHDTLQSITLVDSHGNSVDFTERNYADDAYELTSYFGSNIELSMSDLPIDTYTLTVTPIMGDLVGAVRTYTFNVTGEPIVPITAPLSPLDVTITVDAKYLTSPTNINITPNDSGNNLSWIQSTDVDTSGYYIYRNGILIANIKNETTYQDKNSVAGVNYEYEVIAYNITTGKVSGEVIFIADNSEIGVPPEVVSSIPDLPSEHTLYVDNLITESCNTYHVVNRTCGAGTEQAYKTLKEAADTAIASTQVWIRGGSFTEILYPKNSGLAQKPIIFSAFEAESVIISDTDGSVLSSLPEGEWDDISWLKTGIYLWEKSYITINNITVKDVHSWARIVRGGHIKLEGNTFLNATVLGGRASIKFIDSHNNQILNNIINGGNDNLFLLASNYNLVDGNTILSGRHTLWTIKSGNYNLIRNNYFYNELEKIGEVVDANDPEYGEDEPHFNLTSVDNAKFNVIENNEFAYTPPNDGNYYQGIQYAGQNGIIRNNIFYANTGSGIDMANYGDEAEHTSDNRFYHNVFYQNHFGGITLASTTTLDFTGNVVKNNIFYQNDFQNYRGTDFLSWINLDDKPVQILSRRTDGVTFVNNNIINNEAGEDYVISGMYFNDEDPREEIAAPLTGLASEYQALFTDNIEFSPDFTDTDTHDFSLNTASPMIDRAAFLTQTVSAGTGFVIAVTDSLYFTDHTHLTHVNGDIIQLEGSTITANIVSINHIENTITIDKVLTWTANQGVSLAYSGSAPDLGAQEYTYQ